ncbi:MAG: hypothetical protein KDA41_09680, partial [Planctomycetales bacterium]|nr:hypothetical protein [Planctomycetales bacterium]
MQGLIARQRLRFLIAAGLLLLAAAPLRAAKDAAKNDAKAPNIVFIFADDQCYATIHGLGNAEIETPNL